MIIEVFAPGMSAMSAPVRRARRRLGVVTIAGPLVRLTEERMADLGEPLMATAAEIAGPERGVVAVPPLGLSPAVGLHPGCTKVQ